MNINFVIIFMSVLCILGMVSLLLRNKSTIETFNTATCSFDPTPEQSNTQLSCLLNCSNYANKDARSTAERNDCLNTEDGTSESGCQTICNDTISTPCRYMGGPDGSYALTRCIINPSLEIRGDTLEQCVENCFDSTCEGCKDFRTLNGDTVIFGSYTRDIDQYRQNCNSDPVNHQFCSPCIRECIECNSATRCTWLKTNEELDQDRQAFNNHQFRVGVIPDNKSAVVVWNETSSKVTNYLIYVYKKADKNLDVNRNQQTPLMIRTINKEYTSTGNNSHRITGLTNGVTYSISVNKVSSINDESGQKLIKASNTIDIVPSFVNLINFSALDRDNTLKQERLKSLGTMDSLRGKHLNFNIS